MLQNVLESSSKLQTIELVSTPKADQEPPRPFDVKQAWTDPKQPPSTKLESPKQEAPKNVPRKTAEKPVEKPVEKPIEKNAEKPVEKPIEKAVEKAEKPAEVKVQEQTKQVPTKKSPPQSVTAIARTPQVVPEEKAVDVPALYDFLL